MTSISFEQFRDPLEQNLPVIGEENVLALFNEELLTQFLFEAGDAVTDGARADGENFRRFADMLVLGRLQEIDELVELHAQVVVQRAIGSKGLGPTRERPGADKL